MTLEVRFLGRVDYPPTFAAMKDFVAQRLPGEREQLWILKYRGAGAQRTTPR